MVLAKNSYRNDPKASVGPSSLWAMSCHQGFVAACVLKAETGIFGLQGHFRFIGVEPTLR
ncbi:MAG: hypothetical protein WBX25_30295 [Rhodomicrobium sp.]